nr:hypothetical protein [Tanacetum cinerariifolium]
MIFDGMLRNLDNVSGKFLMYPRFIQTILDKQLDGLPTHKEKYDASFHTKKVFANMKRIGKGFSGKETPLFPTMVGPNQVQMDEEDKLKGTKNAQKTKIDGLERRVKKLEKKHMSRTHKLKRLYKVGLTARVISSSNDEALDKEDTSKHGRIDEIDADDGIALVSTHDDVSTQDNIVQDEGIEDVDEEEVVEVVTTSKMIIDTIVDAVQVTTAIVNIPVSVAETIVTTAPTITAESTKINVEKRRKFFAAKRDEEKRNKPPTKAQQKSIMSTYLKNIDGWKIKSLKKKSFNEIQELFDKAMKSINNFVDFRTELVEESSKKDEAEITKEISSKRAETELEQENAMKQKMKDDKESAELKQCLEIIPDDGNYVTIDATPLSSKYPTIVDYKIYKEGKKYYLQIIRADARFEKVQPVDNMDSFLLHNLKTMFAHHDEDNVWNNQQGLTKVKNWELFDPCRVHCVIMQNILYYLLVEKMYPLTHHTLHQMFNDVKLQVDYECEMAYELLRLVKKQLKKDMYLNEVFR